MKKIALFMLWLALAVEGGYIFWARLAAHATWAHLAQPLLFLLFFGVLGITRARVNWVAVVLRMILGAEFALSVADRFGWLGAPGSSVSWGDFAHFVTYTHQVNAFLPVSFAPILAVLATICESTFAVTLLLGFRLREASAGTALLLCLFGSAMVASGLVESQFFYAVFVLASGAWVISLMDASWMSIDRLLRHSDRCRMRGTEAGSKG